MLVLPASLTHREAPDAVRMLAQTIRRETSGSPAGEASPLAIDASALTQFDSSALAVLLDCKRQAAAAGRALELRHAPPKLRQLARLYGLGGLLGGPDTASPAEAPTPSSGST